MITRDDLISFSLKFIKEDKKKRKLILNTLTSMHKGLVEVENGKRPDIGPSKKISK